MEQNNETMARIEVLLKKRLPEAIENMPYHELDHYHCWNQHYPKDTHPEGTACGILPEEHAVCCLCGADNPSYICTKNEGH